MNLKLSRSDNFCLGERAIIAPVFYLRRAEKSQATRRENGAAWAGDPNGWRAPARHQVALAMPKSPGQVVFIGALGKFRLAGHALVVLLFESPGFFAGENSARADLHQIFMRLAIKRFLGLIFTQFTKIHVSPPDCRTNGVT
jgi:hypothetical protein